MAEPSDDAASRSLEVLRQISSTGYLRKRLPQELTVLQGGQATGFASDGSAAVAYQSRAVESVSVAPMDARTKAKMQGYEGDPAANAATTRWCGTAPA